MSTEEKKNSQIFQDSDNFYYPEDEQQLSEVVKKLYKKNLPTEIVGTGSKSFIGNKIQSANKLKLSRLSGIIEYLSEELYIKVKACTPIELIEQELDKNNQELAFEPLDFGFIEKGKSNKGTIGGYLSCNFAGPRRFKVGSVRDHILGFRGVNGKGDIIKSGGTVVKNVTGYDLSKLIAGSFGTLVALTEVTLKVLPKKNSLSTIIIHTEDKKLVSGLFDKISGSSSEISAAIYIPDEPKNKNYNLNKEMIFKFNDLKYKGSFLALRLEGDKTSIDERIKELIKELELNKLKTSILDVYQSTPFWKKVNNLELFSHTKNNLVRVVIPPSNGIKLMKHLGDKYKYYIDWCGALYWIEIQSKKINKIVEIKKIVREFGGYLTIIKTSLDYDYEESIFTVDNTRLLISEKIKKSFDPKRIFNPGKMYRGDLMQTNFTEKQLKDKDNQSTEKIFKKCVHCGMCNATCPTYQLLGDELDGPRGRIYLIQDMLENEKKPTPKVVKHIDKCLSCYSCMTTCPAGVNYMHVIDHGRKYIEKNFERPFFDRVIRNFLSVVLPNTLYFRIASFFVKMGKPFQFLMPSKIKDMMNLMPTNFPKKTLKQKEVYSAKGKKKSSKSCTFNRLCSKRNFTSN